MFLFVIFYCLAGVDMQQLQSSLASMTVRAAQIGTVALKAHWNGTDQPAPREMQLSDVYVVVRTKQHKSALQKVQISPNSNSQLTTTPPKASASASNDGAKVPGAESQPETAATTPDGLHSMLTMIENIKVCS